MKILVGCEERQAVTIELRKLGHEAFSCDIMESSGGHPEWHLKIDVFQAIELNRNFIGCDINPNAIEITKSRLNAVQ